MGKNLDNPTTNITTDRAGDSQVHVTTPAREVVFETFVMVGKGNWYSLHRKVFDDDDFDLDEPYTEIQAWIWLIGFAAWEDKDVCFQKRMVKIHRGQCVTSIRYLCKKWKWGNTRTTAFLNRLEKVGKISRHSQDRKQTLITICNYDNYQYNSQPQQDSNRNTDKTQTRHRQDTTNNINNINKEINNIISLYHKHCPSFPKVAKITPKRKSAINARLEEYPEIEYWEQLFKDIEQSDFLKHGSGTWPGANIDWIMNPNNLVKILEGQYKNRKAEKPQGQFSVTEMFERRRNGEQ